MKQLQQGDVNFEQVKSIPRRANPVKRKNGRYILMDGEQTGHAHAVCDDIELFEADGILYMKNDKPVDVVHEEHHTQKVQPGIWEVTPTHEYDHFLESERRVID